MFWQNANLITSAVWALLESLVIILVPLLFLNKKFRKIEDQLSRINYAIWNDGKTGLKNIVDEKLPLMEKALIVIQTKMGIEVE